MEFLVQQVMKPIIARLGTALGLLLAAQGVEADTINVITGGAIAAAGVIVDLITRQVLSKKGN